MSISAAFFAVVGRNVRGYFARPLGFVIAFVFVVAATLLTFQSRFFAENRVTLDQLTTWFPWLLLFGVPAITMSAWSEERRTGTDSLLFTLPMGDAAIVGAKYLAVLVCYTLTLLFCLPIVGCLAWLGQPDYGTLLATGIGYWLAGGALSSAGLFASSLTTSATVAFVLGAVFCSIPVFISQLVVWTPSVRWLSIEHHLRDFAQGTLPVSGLVATGTVVVTCLYLNYVVITKRRWSASNPWRNVVQFGIRFVSLAVILVGLFLVTRSAGWRADLTASQIYRLSETTQQTLARIDDEHPVTIRAFVSSDVPPGYEDLKQRIIGVLREYDREAPSQLEVSVTSVTPFSPEADEAEYFDIERVNRQERIAGRTIEEDLYLGLVITGPADEVVLPFVDQATPLEHELTTAIATVLDEKPIRVGVLSTEASLIGRSEDRAIVRKMRQLYDIRDVQPAELTTDSESPAQIDVLIAVMPSSLTDADQQALASWCESGHPVLIFDDPLPFFSPWNRPVVRQSPRQPPLDENGRPQRGVRKADDGRASALLQALGISWTYDEVAIDVDNPHPEHDYLSQEWVFITPSSGGDAAFNQTHPATKGLSELLTVFPGTVQPLSDRKGDFTPLLRTGPRSGLLQFDDYAYLPKELVGAQREQVISRGYYLNPDRPLKQDEYYHVIAAHLKREEPALNTIFVADTDLIADWIVNERDANQYDLALDNVTFVLNCIDVLAEDTRYLQLRRRRRESRPLQRFESLTKSIREERLAAQLDAQESAEAALKSIREAGQERERRIRQDDSLDDNARQTQLELERASQARMLEVRQKAINSEKQATLDRIGSQARRSIQSLEQNFVWVVTLLNPLPVVLCGLLVFCWRLVNERRTDPERRRDHAATSARNS